MRSGSIPCFTLVSQACKAAGAPDFPRRCRGFNNQVIVASLISILVGRRRYSAVNASRRKSLPIPAAGMQSVVVQQFSIDHFLTSSLNSTLHTIYSTGVALISPPRLLDLLLHETSHLDHVATICAMLPSPIRLHVH
jgi:hypothetical protein